jgi:electron transfer flavoprotein alpha subunit
MSQDVFVLVEHLKGQLTDGTFELLGIGREVAPQAGGRLVALLLGKDVRGLAEQLGAADVVLYVEDERLSDSVPEAYRRVLAGLLREKNPKLTLLPTSSLGMDLGGALSVDLNLPLIAFCKQLAVQDGSIVATCELYGGRAVVESEIHEGSGLALVLPGACPADKGRSERAPAVEEVKPSVDLAEVRVRFKGLIEPPPGDVDITRQEILVSVGRGVQRQENLPIVQELADALGAALSSSRPVVDQQWLPPTRQVGKSGMTVKPRLYLAVGISGAPEHVEGMRDSDLIVAINSDARAPIFNVAHYGAVADLFDVVPKLAEAVKKRGA